MNNIKLKNYAWLLIMLALATWLILIIISEGSFKFTAKTLLQIPNVISINVFVWFVFIKWLWKCKLFRGWLVPFPNLSGSWKGQAIPKTIDQQTGQPYKPVVLTATIKQTFLTIHVRVFSKEMESNSYSTFFVVNPETDEKRLCYSYVSRPIIGVRERNPIHDGTALLTIKGENDDELGGEYWTNRETIGELYLKRVQ